mgnify:CR=1 FL=1
MTKKTIYNYHLYNAILVFFILVCAYTTSYAQESVLFSGGKLYGAGGTISYSFGQVFYNNYLGSSGSILEGNQQPNEISLANGTYCLYKNSIQLKVYPNPATDKLILNVSNPEKKTVYYKLYCINGKLLKENLVEESITEILLNDLTPSVYYLKVTDDNDLVRIYEIIKL